MTNWINPPLHIICGKYYPVSYTIVEQMDDPKINLDL